MKIECLTHNRVSFYISLGSDDDENMSRNFKINNTFFVNQTVIVNKHGFEVTFIPAHMRVVVCTFPFNRPCKFNNNYISGIIIVYV